MISRTLIALLAFFVGLLTVTVFAQAPARGVSAPCEWVNSPTVIRTYQIPLGSDGQLLSVSTGGAALATAGAWTATLAADTFTGVVATEGKQDDVWEYGDDNHCYVMSTKMLYEVFNTMGFDEAGKRRPRNTRTLVYVTPYEMWRGNKEMYHNIREFYSYVDRWQVDIDSIKLNSDGSFWDIPKRVDCPADRE